MDQLFAKITNFSYELFGVILPGFISLIFLILLWVAIGPLAPWASSSFFPQLTSYNAGPLIESISVKTGIGIAAPTLLVTYFLGHILLWISRSGKQSSDIVKNWRKRVFYSLLMRIPKPSESYDSNLKPLYDLVQAEFARQGTSLTWPQFYPIARSHLSEKITHSLVSNYQNKYTLHRSITSASAAIFWLSLFAVIIGLITQHYYQISPRWWPLGSLNLFSLILVWGFSDSYAYNWKLYGNSIITESYALIFGPK